MTQQEHLNRIRARCVELLSIWDNKKDHNPLYNATCGKEAEAGWKATIAAIDSLSGYASLTESDNPSVRLIGGEAQDGINSIIASWPAELL